MCGGGRRERRRRREAERRAAEARAAQQRAMAEARRQADQARADIQRQSAAALADARKTIGVLAAAPKAQPQAAVEKEIQRSAPPEPLVGARGQSYGMVRRRKSRIAARRKSARQGTGRFRIPLNAGLAIRSGSVNV